MRCRAGNTKTTRAPCRHAPLCTPLPVASWTKCSAETLSWVESLLQNTLPAPTPAPPSSPSPSPGLCLVPTLGLHRGTRTRHRECEGGGGDSGQEHQFCLVFCCGHTIPGPSNLGHHPPLLQSPTLSPSMAPVPSFHPRLSHVEPEDPGTT